MFLFLQWMSKCTTYLYVIIKLLNLCSLHFVLMNNKSTLGQLYLNKSFPFLSFFCLQIYKSFLQNFHPNSIFVKIRYTNMNGQSTKCLIFRLQTKGKTGKQNICTWQCLSVERINSNLTLMVNQTPQECSCSFEGRLNLYLGTVLLHYFVCVCVCVCERERERQHSR